MTASRRWSAAVTVVLTALLVLTGCGLGGGVDDFVGSSYTRAANLDDGTAKAYTASQAPDDVLQRIAGAERPLDTLRGTSGQYLQYRDRMVRVAPAAAAAAGSVILIDNYANGYRRWAGDVAQRWGAIPPNDDDDDFGK